MAACLRVAALRRVLMLPAPLAPVPSFIANSAARAGRRCVHIPPATWSIQEHLRQAAGDSFQLTDAEVVHVAELSHLHFEPGTPEFAAIKKDLTGILRTLHALRSSAASSSSSSRATALGGSIPASGAPAAAAPATDALGAARIADLRRDVPNDAAPREALLARAAMHYQGYYVVPRTVGGDES